MIIRSVSMSIQEVLVAMILKISCELVIKYRRHGLMHIYSYVYKLPEQPAHEDSF